MKCMPPFLTSPDVTSFDASKVTAFEIYSIISVAYSERKMPIFEPVAATASSRARSPVK